MTQLSDRHLFTDITPESLWAKTAEHQGLLLPHVLRQSAFGHYRESTGEHFGFQMQTPWDALPAGEWKVLVDTNEIIPAKKAVYHIDVAIGAKELYSGDLTFDLVAVENDTAVTLVIDGDRKLGLEPYSNDLVDTILRSLIRESWEAVDQLLASHSSSDADSQDEDGQFSNHMDPLALAAGVFSAGMAVGLWLWRRKRKDQDV